MLLYSLLISSSFRFSKATRTASTTKAVKVQSFPLIAVSTSSITSFGNLIHLFVVGGIDGILNFFTKYHLCNTYVYIVYSKKIFLSA